MQTTTNTTYSLSILSGKGGVGKTNLALNLGFALYKASHPVLLMDCDLGLANLDVMLGLAPDKTIQDLLAPGVTPDQVAVPIEPGGFDFLPSASGVPDLVEMDEDLQAVLFKKLTSMFSRYDYLLLDLGAGISHTVLDFAAMTHERIVIVTPEPTSLTDGYALIKIMQARYGVSDFHVVVNMAENKAEGEKTFARLNAACERFLSLSLNHLGTVRNDHAVSISVIRQTPLLRSSPTSPAAKDILTLAARLKRRRDSLLPDLAGVAALKNFLPKTSNKP